MSVLVIGAGPAGLASMSCLIEQGLRPTWVDRQGVCGGSYCELYPRIVLASPARWTSLPGLTVNSPGPYLNVAQYREYLESYARRLPYGPQTAEVQSLQHDGRRFGVMLEGRWQEFQAVVCATGLDQLNWPSYAGEGSDGQVGCANPEVRWLHSRHWQGPQEFAGKRLLIIGRGVSAVEIAEEAAGSNLDIQVTLSAAGPVKLSPQRLFGRDVHDFAFLFSWLPRWLAWGYCRRSPTFSGYDQGFTRWVAEGRLRLKPLVQHFLGQEALFVDGSTEHFDAVVCATGYSFGLPFLPPEVARSRAGGHPLGNRGESVNCPGLYLMGVHCARGVSSQFLRGMALDAPAVAASVRRRLESS